MGFLNEHLIVRELGGLQTEVRPREKGEEEMPAALPDSMAPTDEK